MGTIFSPSVTSLPGYGNNTEHNSCRSRQEDLHAGAPGGATTAVEKRLRSNKCTSVLARAFSRLVARSKVRETMWLLERGQSFPPHTPLSAFLSSKSLQIKEILGNERAGWWREIVFQVEEGSSIYASDTSRQSFQKLYPLCTLWCCSCTTNRADVLFAAIFMNMACHILFSHPLKKENNAGGWTYSISSRTNTSLHFNILLRNSRNQYFTVLTGYSCLHSYRES